MMFKLEESRREGYEGKGMQVLSVLDKKFRREQACREGR